MMTNCMTPSFLATQGIITQDVTSVNEFAAFNFVEFFLFSRDRSLLLVATPAPTIRAKY